jgi:hypothetical protein
MLNPQRLAGRNNTGVPSREIWVEAKHQVPCLHGVGAGYPENAGIDNHHQRRV